MSFVVLVVSGAVAALANAAPELKSMRVATQNQGVGQGNTTRVVFDLSEKTREKVFTLANPHRVVVDLPATTFNTSLPVGEGAIKTIRAGKRDDGSLRVVLDVTSAVTIRTTWLPAEAGTDPRLVLDVVAPMAVPTATPAAQPAEPTIATSANAGLAAIADTPAQDETAGGDGKTEITPDIKPVKSFNGHARDVVIAIDAGHGGEDPGALGRRGAREKDVTLAIARLLKQRIDAEPGMRAVLTRDGDYFVPLRDRINRARQHQADMFISIHADAVHDSRVTGSSVYTLSPKGATSEAARYLAARENAADLVGGVSLDDKSNVLASVLLDLTQGASMSASMDAAGRVLRQLDRIGDTHHSIVQQAGFVVLKSPDIPSMLVETAFISNPSEEARLTDPRHQSRIADAVLGGVRDYFITNTPPGTRLAQLKAMRQARVN